jgi:hypothetical protein
LVNPATDEDPTVTFGVRLMPLSLWLWIGGALLALGTILAAFPGRRRRPTDPVSAPVPSATATPPATDPSDLVGVPRLGSADV